MVEFRKPIYGDGTGVSNVVASYVSGVITNSISNTYSISVTGKMTVLDFPTNAGRGRPYRLWA